MAADPFLLLVAKEADKALIKALRFNGRHASETNAAAATRRVNERAQAADRIEALSAARADGPGGGEIERVARLCCIGDPDQLVFITPEGEGVRSPHSGVDRPGKLWELQIGRARRIIETLREPEN